MTFKYIRTLVAALLMVAAGSHAALAADNQSQIDPAAESLARTYFSALQSGNRQVLLSLFTGTARARNEAQLNDPAYSQFLVERYSTARLEIVAGGVHGGISFVDIAIWLNGNEFVGERLLLKPSADPADASLYIVARKELLN